MREIILSMLVGYFEFLSAERFLERERSRGMDEIMKRELSLSLSTYIHMYMHRCNKGY